LRIGGLAVIAVALLANLPGAWAMIAGLAGVVMFLAAGPT
jgi:hypothetical protein